jgi:hypothetical protein
MYRMALLWAGYSVQCCIYLLPEVKVNPEVQNRKPGPKNRHGSYGPRPQPPSPGPWCHETPSGGPQPTPDPWNSMGIRPFLNPEVGSEKSGSVKNHRLTRVGGALRHPKHPLSTRNEHGKAEYHEDASPRRPTRKSLYTLILERGQVPGMDFYGHWASTVHTCGP